MKYTIKFIYNNENIFFWGQNQGGGAKNKNLSHLSKLDQILYT